MDIICQHFEDYLGDPAVTTRLLVCMILQRYISRCEFTYYSQEILSECKKNTCDVIKV